MLDRFKAIVESIRRSATSAIVSGVEADDSRVGITFRFDDVVPSTDPLWMSTLGESLALRSGSRVLLMPDRDLPALAAEGYYDLNARLRVRERVDLPSDTAPSYQPLRRIGLSARKLSGLDPKSFEKFFEPSEVLGRHAAEPMLHPLMQAIHLAFSQHRPLVLSPDVI